MSRVIWKVCGITDRAGASAAVTAGADALGFVFWPHSPRGISAAEAGEIVARVSEQIWKVGVFVNPSDDEIGEVVERVGLDFVQLSGDEPPSACEQLPRPGWKALRLAPGCSPQEAETEAAQYAGCTLVVDAAVPGAYGGTGQVADWSAAAALARQRRVVLAGGLRADNVAAAIRQVRPWAVDVSSGVESAPGLKDRNKLRAFATALESCR